MKKIIPIVLIGILVLSGLGAGAFSEKEYVEKTERIIFSDLTINEENHDSIVKLENANSWLKKANHPILPAFTKTYTFPFGTEIKNIDVVFSDTKQLILNKKITTAPKPATYVLNKLVYAESENINFESEIYPEEQFSYNIGAGIYKNDHVIFVNVKVHPIQYIQSEDTIIFSRNADIKITYRLPPSQTTVRDTYDMVVIAPSKFSTALQPLVDHKNNYGVVTQLVTIEEIYDSTYFPVQGRDCAEEIKYFIKSAYDEWGIDYVLLVGGRNGGVMQEKWWVPVRYSHLNDGSEGSYLTDLYFADIYDDEGNFSSWDSNENDVFAEWTNDVGGKDIIDMVPEIYLGRLPCRNTYEVKIMVNKITNYESTTYGSDWFNKIVCVGGDSAPGDEYYEGEEENQAAIDYLDGFDPVKVWTSDGSFTGVDDVVSAISEGSGFLFFDGHGNPTVWSTHPPNDEETWITGLNNQDMPKLKNGEKLPIAVVGACHNGQFNVSVLNILKGIIEDGLQYFSMEPPLGKFWYKEWTPECWAWLMTRKIGGGSIAIMAYTGLDWFAIGDYNDDGIPDCTQFYSGFANVNFFKNYGVNDLTILGQAHTQTLIDYINEYPPMDEKLDCKTVQEFALLGDPSLQIGGYP